MIDYTKCDKATPNFTPIPQDSYTVNFPGASGNGDAPEFKAVQAVGSANKVSWPMTKCTVKIDIPVKLKHPVFVYYRLSNFYQNHRRYVKSLDAKQLSGVARTATDLKGGGCDPLAIVTENGVPYPIYPCGLIANSIFNGRRAGQYKRQQQLQPLVLGSLRTITNLKTDVIPMFQTRWVSFLTLSTTPPTLTNPISSRTLASRGRVMRESTESKHTQISPKCDHHPTGFNFHRDTRKRHLPLTSPRMSTSRFGCELLVCPTSASFTLRMSRMICCPEFTPSILI